LQTARELARIRPASIDAPSYQKIGAIEKDNTKIIKGWPKTVSLILANNTHFGGRGQ
jgi:hypothetical protein